MLFYVEKICVTHKIYVITHFVEVVCLRKAVDLGGKKMLSLETSKIMESIFREGSILVFLDSLDKGLVVIDRQSDIIFANKAAKKYFGKKHTPTPGRQIASILQSTHLNQVLQDGSSFCYASANMNGLEIHINLSPIEVNRDIIGAMISLETEREEADSFTTLKLCNSISRELENIFNSSYDEIIVSDGTGTILKMNAVFKEFYGMEPELLVGRSVVELESESVFKPSVTMMVLKERKRISIIQKTNTGKVLIVTGHPMFDGDGNLISVISMAKNITELHQLQEKLKEAQNTAQKYYFELEKLKHNDEKAGRVMYRSTKMKKIMAMAEKVARVDSNLLITGESGVGKSMLADVVHRNSERKNGVLVSINCGAIPEALLESELFGYEKGAFTGASTDGKLGTLDLADKGTLFLDEISEMSLHMQVKLLKVIQEKQFTRIGGTKTIQSDFRLIAATNRNLEERVKEGLFREDLYYRLNVVPIEIPPLRDRKEDILLLINYFWNQLNASYGTNRKIDSEAYNVLVDYSWPGNVRELENCIERIFVTVDKDLIYADELPTYLLQSTVIHSAVGIMPLKDAMEDIEKKMIVNAYRHFGNTYRAAEALGVSQSTIVRKLKKYGTVMYSEK